MPIPGYVGYVGIAKDLKNSTIATSVAAAATTFVVASAAGITTSYTVFIWDGVNFESRAITNVSTNTLTVAALTYAHAANTYVSFQLTASVGPTDYIPVTTIEPNDNFAPLEDKGLRGSFTDLYGVTQGRGYSDVSLGGNVHPDTVGYLLGGILGATDFSGGTPNAHSFSVKNATPGQPTGYILYDYSGFNTRAFPSMRFSEVDFKFDPSQLLTWTAKAMAMLSGVVSNPTSSFGTLAPMAAWTGVVTLGGVVQGTVISADLTLKRNITAINTVAGIQGPYSIWVGPLDLDGKMTLVFEDDTIINDYLNNTQPTLDIKFSTGSGASLVSLEFHMNKVAFEDTNKTNRTSDFVEVECSFSAIANTTDATTAGGGMSPVKATLQNAVATGTYL